MSKSMVLSKPNIEKSNKFTRMSVDITEPDCAPFKVFVEVENKYSKYLVTEYIDAFIFLMIPVAIRNGLDIESEAAVSERFLHNLNNILFPSLSKGDERSHFVKIKCKDIYTSPVTSSSLGNVVATSVTCGIDSTYSIKKYSSGVYDEMELTHLFVGSLSIDLYDFDESDNLSSWEKKHPYNFERYKIISDMTGLPLIKCFTNFLTFLCRDRKGEKKMYHGLVHTYITMAAILTLKKLFKTYYFPSSYPYTQFSLTDHLSEDTGHYELMLMQVMSDPNFMCFSSGAEVDRIQKTEFILDYPVAKKTLHPCFIKKDNCSKPTCTKCLRALLTFDYYGKLDDFSEIFDTKRFINNKNEYLKKLVANQNHGFSGFKELYDMYKEREPELINKLDEEHAKSIEPIPRKTYDKLKKAFDIQSFFLSQNAPKEQLTKYFKSKKVKKIYCAGYSLWGKTLIEWLKDDFEIIEKDETLLADCDTVLILETLIPDRIRVKNKVLKLKKDGAEIVTYYNLKKILTENKY